MTPADRYRRLARWHEAGHAVVGVALGHRVRLIVVGDGVRYAGFTEHYQRDDLTPAESDAHDLMMLAAGRMAEDIPMEVATYGALDREPVDEATCTARLDASLSTLPPDDGGFVYYTLTDPRPETAISDTAKAEAIAARLADAERPRIVESCLARTYDLVWSNTTAIAVIAAELSRRPILDGAAFESVIAALPGQIWST